MKLFMRFGTTSISRVRRLEVQLHVFFLGTVWRLKVSFALCRSSQGRTRWYALNRLLSGVQRRYGRKKKYSFSCWEPNLDRPACIKTLYLLR